MKVLFDTNIVLDVLLDRRPFSGSASQLFSHVESGKLTGYLCATTVTTIHYLAVKAASRQSAREHLGNLLKLFEITPVNRLVLETALETEMADFEDAVLVASAHHAGLDALVTRDKRDFSKSPMPIHSPEELLKILT